MPFLVMTSIVSSPAIVPAISYLRELSIKYAVAFACPGMVRITSSPRASTMSLITDSRLTAGSGLAGDLPEAAS